MTRRRKEIKRKRELQQEVEYLLNESIDERRLNRLKVAKRELKEVLDRDEKYWRQRSRVHWLKEGDRNTSFFHARANGRRNKNLIKGVFDEYGNWVQDTEGIFNVARDYFLKLYQSEGDVDSNRILEAIETCITPEMNSKLCTGFTREEVNRAFLHIHPNKAPGLDDFFRPSRGLRQGDPLSPFLFLFCTQGLSALLLKEQRLGNIKGVRASQIGLRISHMLYADDCLLFMKNYVEEARNFKEILGCYERASGQKINTDKSYIYFSQGTPTGSKEAIKDVLNMREEEEVGTYLGLPLIVGKSKLSALGFLIEKVDKKVHGWIKNLLSYGGREVLLKAVAQALPAYAMGCFLLPDCILDPITSTMRNYWWSGRARERGWAHVAWTKICRPKQSGGLGLRDLHMFNMAMLAKQVWRLLTNRESLSYKVLAGKYFPSGDILDAKKGDKPSFVWSSIHKAKEEFKEGFMWRLGINSKVQMFRDRWGGEKPVLLSEIHIDSPANPVRCGEFMHTDRAEWDERKIRQVFNEEDAKAILSCPICPIDKDQQVWSHMPSGIYSVKSGYRWLIANKGIEGDNSKVWKAIADMETLPKVKIFGWRLCREALPLGKKLEAAGIGNGICKLCQGEMETGLHAFRDCPSLKEAFDLTNLTDKLPVGEFQNCKVWIECAHARMEKNQFTLFMVLLWNLWNRRNKWIHDAQLLPQKLIVDYAQLLVTDFLKAKEDSIPGREEQRVRRWSKPLQNIIKVNVDGAFRAELGEAAIGIVARNHQGLMVDGSARKLHGVHSSHCGSLCV